MSAPFIEARELCIDFPISAGHPPDRGDGARPESAGRLIDVAGRTFLRALDSVSLTLRPGERLGVWGKNGSGKTTLLRTLRGVYPPTSGALTVCGQTQSFFNLSFGFNEDATGYENILLRGVLMGATPKQMKALSPQISDFTELGEFLSLPLRNYSAGMRMRLAFSVAMALPADILLMDEWLSVGDVDFRQKAADRMKEVVETTKVLVITSHNRMMLEGVCTRIITLNEGRIVSDVPVTKTYEKIPFWDPETGKARV